MTTTRDFHVEAIDYASGAAPLHQVRDVVFVQEQQVPPELERDALDPLSHHVLARDGAGTPIGTARLTPEHRIGRMAVLQASRKSGVGTLLLRALEDEARRQGVNGLMLHAQLSAMDFYKRHDYVPHGGVFEEAGMPHLEMKKRL